MRVITVVMKDRLRRAMMHPDPSKPYEVVVNGILEAYRFFLRYVSPRLLKFVRYDVFTEEPDKNGSYFYKTYKDFPYYNKPTFWVRWGPQALIWRAIGGEVLGDARYHPQGYVYEELGTRKVVGKGKDKTDAWEKKLTAERTAARCPFRR